jgi:hypothetical protein
MNYQIVLHFQTSNEAIDLAMAALIHQRLGGQYFRIDDRRKRLDDPAGCALIRTDRLDDFYSSLLGSGRGGVVDVVPECRQAVLDFVQERPGTAGDVGVCVITSSPGRDAQDATIKTMEGLLDGGMDPSRIRIVFSGLEPDQAVESLFPHVRQYALGQLPNCTMAVVGQRVTRALEKVLRTQVPIGMVLNHGVDFEEQLRDARLAGATQDVLKQLATKLLSQRLLEGVRAEIEQLSCQLGLPEVSPERWVEEDSQREVSAPRSDIHINSTPRGAVELTM